MDGFNKITSLSEKIAAALLKGESPMDLEGFNMFSEEDKKKILFSITNINERKKHLEFSSKLNKEKASKIIFGGKE